MGKVFDASGRAVGSVNGWSGVYDAGGRKIGSMNIFSRKVFDSSGVHVGYADIHGNVSDVSGRLACKVPYFGDVVTDPTGAVLGRVGIAGAPEPMPDMQWRGAAALLLLTPTAEVAPAGLPQRSSWKPAAPRFSAASVPSGQTWRAGRAERANNAIVGTAITYLVLGPLFILISIFTSEVGFFVAGIFMVYGALGFHALGNVQLKRWVSLQSRVIRTPMTSIIVGGVMVVFAGLAVLACSLVGWYLAILVAEVAKVVSKNDRRA